MLTSVLDPTFTLSSDGYYRSLLAKVSMVEKSYPSLSLTSTPFLDICQGEGDHQAVPGLEPSPCFYNFLARTTFVLESLLEAKNPGQDAFLGDFVFNSSNS